MIDRMGIVVEVRGEWKSSTTSKVSVVSLTQLERLSKTAPSMDMSLKILLETI